MVQNVGDMHLGPLEVTPYGCTVDAAVGSGGVGFHSMGVRLRSTKEGIDEEVQWADVWDIKIEGPTVTGPSWFLYGLVNLLAPTVARMPWVEVIIRRQGGNDLQVHLGRTGNAPYSYKYLEALDALLVILQEKGSLRLLGDASEMSKIIPVCVKLSSYIPSITHFRIRRAVIAVLATDYPR